MAKKDLKFVLDTYRDKDRRGETYYLTVKAYDKEGSEVLLLSHLNNKTATGAAVLKSIAKRVEGLYNELFIEEFRAFSGGTTGAIEPVATHIVLLKSDSNGKPAVQDESFAGVGNNQVFELFGGFQGFVEYTKEQSKVSGKLEGLVEKISDIKEEKALLLAKLGNEEAENKTLKAEIRQLESKLRDLRWKYEDTERTMKNRHDDELRRYKGQNALISAGMQGLGSFITKKLNVSDSDLAGLLGVDLPEGQSSSAQAGKVDPNIKQAADEIFNWMLSTSLETMNKVYAVFSHISSNEGNLNHFAQLASGTTQHEEEEVVL